MSVLKTFALVAVPGLLLAGCTQTSRFDNPGPLAPAPVGVVESSELQPAGATPPDQNDPNATGEFKPTLEPGQQVASAEPAKPPPTDGGQPVTRQALTGTWQVNTGGQQCQIILAFTKWSGGYRAAQRGCSGTSISDVQAWDVKGKQVVLVNSSGATAARLYRSGQARYDGATTAGGAISFSR